MRISDWSSDVCSSDLSTLDVIRERGKLLAGVRFDAPPNGYVSPQGENVGFGPDLAREFARHLGVELELVQVTSMNRNPLLQSGQLDTDIGTTTPTQTREIGKPSWWERVGQNG